MVAFAVWLVRMPLADFMIEAALSERGLEAAEDVARQFPILNDYQPYWALKADLCARLGRRDAARAAYDEAILREADRAVLAFLEARRDRL